MNPKYPHRRWSPGLRIALVFVVILGLLAGGVGLFVFMDMQQNDSTAVQGASQVVAQGTGADNKKFVADHALFSMELPSDWKEVSRRNDTNEQSITWQATKKNYDNRTLKIYIDRMPQPLPVNKILVVAAQGNRLARGEMSDNCINFTSGGTKNPTPDKAQDRPAKWAGVDFICEMGSTIDNQIGVGSTDGLNQVAVTGQKGKHKYFFIYTDRNIHPDPSILYDAIESFKAK